VRKLSLFGGTATRSPDLLADPVVCRARVVTRLNLRSVGLSKSAITTNLLSQPHTIGVDQSWSGEWSPGNASGPQAGRFRFVRSQAISRWAAA